MKINPFHLILLMMCLCTHGVSYAQSDVQFHTDRTYYFPGDTVWYKGYLTYNGRPDKNVRNLGVAIGHPNKEIIEQQVRPVSNGLTYGQYIIPHDYKDHELYFNLYSKRNENSALPLFVTKIGVYQNKRVLSDIRPAVSIFVDGGGLLPNMDSKVRFQWNVHFPIHGIIRDEAGQEIMTVRANESGRAGAQLKTNTSTDRLYLHWSYQGKDYLDTLPVSRTGVRLRLLENNDTAFLLIENQSSFRNMMLQFKPDSRTTREKELCFGTDSMMQFAVEELLGGSFIGDFLVVYQDSVLANLRLDHYNAVVPELSIEEFSVDPYGKNSINIKLPGRSTWGVSISIHEGLLPSRSDDINDLIYERAGKYQYSSPMYIQDKELQDSVLTLRGRISMMPDKWHKFLEQREKRKQRLKRESKSIKDVSFGYRLVTEPDFLYEEVEYDTSGYLQLRNITFYDTLQVRVVQIDDRLKTFDYEMEWEYSNLKPLEHLTIPDFISGVDLGHVYSGMYDPNYYTLPSGDRVIKEVGVAQKRSDPRIQKMQKRFSKGWFDRESVMDIDLLNEGIPDWVFTVDELTEYLKNKYPLIRRYGDMVLANNVHNRDTVWIGGGMPLDVTEIVLVRVYEKYIQNPSGGGAIMYYTSGVNARNTDIGVSKINLAKVPGYSGFLDFRHPDYGDNDLPQYDDRQTLYWNPDIQVTGGVQFPVTFYNNSISDSFTVTIQGMSGVGRVFRFSKTMTKADVAK